MPLRELRKKFTLSEMYVIGWRSGEIRHNMEASYGRSESEHRSQEIVSQSEVNNGVNGSVTKRHKKYKEGELPEGTPAHLFNEDGELDLRRATQEEAYAYFAACGIKLPMMSRSR